MKYLFIIVVMGVLLSCGPRQGNNTQQDTSAGDTFDEELDTLYVENNMVVFLWPDSSEQIVMKEKYDENSYNKFVDDLTWYTEKAVQMLDSLKVEHRITDKDVVILKSADKDEIVYNRRELQGNMILFKAGTKPVITSMTGYNRKEVHDYFKQSD